MGQVRHQRAAGRFHFVRDFLEIEGKPQVAAELVGEHVERRLEHPADGRNRAGFLLHAADLRAECGKVIGHRPGGFHEGEVAAHRCSFIFRGNPRKPFCPQEGDGVFDEFVVFLALHPCILRVGLPVLEAGVLVDVDARDGVIAKPGRLREPGPHVNHVGHGGVPVVVAAAADDGFKRQAVVVRHLLRRHAAVGGGELGGEGADRDAVGLAVPHRGDIAVQPLRVDFLEIGGHGTRHRTQNTRGKGRLHPNPGRAAGKARKFVSVRCGLPRACGGRRAPGIAASRGSLRACDARRTGPCVSVALSLCGKHFAPGRRPSARLGQELPARSAEARSKARPDELPAPAPFHSGRYSFGNGALATGRASSSRACAHCPRNLTPGHEQVTSPASPHSSR
jgi:hypothetical protein